MPALTEVADWCVWQRLLLSICQFPVDVTTWASITVGSSVLNGEKKENLKDKIL